MIQNITVETGGTLSEGIRKKLNSSSVLREIKQTFDKSLDREFYGEEAQGRFGVVLQDTAVSTLEKMIEALADKRERKEREGSGEGSGEGSSESCGLHGQVPTISMLPFFAYRFATPPIWL